MGGHLICRLVTVFGQRSCTKSQVYVCDPQNVVEMKLNLTPPPKKKIAGAPLRYSKVA